MHYVTHDYMYTYCAHAYTCTNNASQYRDSKIQMNCIASYILCT